HAFTVENISTSLLIREHIEYNFAKYQESEEKDQSLLNIVVGGGGFTGVEVVGELANKLPKLCEEYNIDKNLVRIFNIDGSPTVLNGFDPELEEYAMNSLESRGVEFINGSILKEVREDSITYETDGEQFDIPTRTTIWAAGVRANERSEER